MRYFQSVSSKLFLHALGALFAWSCVPVAAGGFTDPLTTPAPSSSKAAHKPLLAAAVAGTRLIGVGLRGTIVYSDDAGTSWQQAQVPTSVDLVAVSFPSSLHGWAVGHAGIVLNSQDGGKTWTKQLDGRQAAELVVKYYGATERSPAVDRVLELQKGQMKEAESGAAPPFLDVNFENERSGFVVGAFNRIFRTDDGGKTWVPWMAKVDNPDAYHFYAIQRSASHVYLVGEQGKVWRYSAESQKFSMIATPYNGTLFGVVARGSTVVVFGMRGNVFRSADAGNTWQSVAMKTKAGISSGAVLADGRIVLASLSGEVFQSEDDGKSFAVLPLSDPMPSYFGVIGVSEGRVAVVGFNGIRAVSLRAS